MKKKIVSIFASLAMGMSMISLNPMVFAEEYCPFSGGTGTEDNPYQIATAYDLRHLSELVNNPEETENYTKCYYIQTDDINLNDGRDKFTPIGEWVENHVPFRGNYNGNYHKIKNLDVNNDLDYVGLFGIVMGGTISNLSVEGNVITTGAICGGIAGEISENTNIKNCSFTGNVSGNRYAVGGIAGQLVRGGEVTSCYFNGNVDVKNVCCGGIIGTLSDQKVVCNSKITNCYAVGTVKAESLYGGILGNTERNQNDSAYVVENNYYLDSMSNIGSSGVVTNGCQSMDSDSLKNIDKLLGSPFMHNGSPELNDGYPVFEWQIIPYQFKGSGTEADPYQISSKEELEKMRDLVNSVYFNPVYGNAHYIQTADIDLKNEKWTPIGTFLLNTTEQRVIFMGNYDGNYHKIFGLNVNEDTGYSGLFGRIGEGKTATICDLNVSGNVVSKGSYVGGICGEIAYGSQIANCSFNGNVKGDNYVGGIVGKFLRDAEISSCYHIGTVEATSIAGGILGYRWTDSGNTIISDCYHVGKVTAVDESAGAILGLSVKNEDDNSTISIKNCYALNGDCKNNVTANGETTENYALVRTQSELKSIGSDLGYEFINSPDSSNEGYPIFYWQTPMGDVNLDGELGVADIVATQKWLHRSGNMAKWQKADMNGDGKINVVDLCLMKRLLLS